MQQLMMYWDNQKLKSVQPPEGFSIRTYGEGDAQGWIDSCADGLDTGSWTHDDFHKKMLEYEGIRPEGIFLITDAKGRLAGTATGILKGTPGLGYVHMVSIHPDFRGLGLAKPLNAAVMKYLSERGRTKIYLDTDDSRIPAIKTYLWLNFLPVLHTEDMEQRWLKIMEQLGLLQLPTYSQEWELFKVLSR